MRPSSPAARDLLAESPARDRPTRRRSRPSTSTPRSIEQRDRSTRMSKPFLSTRRPTLMMRSPSGRIDGRRILEQSGEVGVQPVVHHVHRTTRCDRLEMLRLASVQVTTNLAALHLAGQQAVRVLIGLVDVLGVAGERERQIEDVRRPPGDRGRAMREVGVDVGDGRTMRQLVGDGSGAHPLLQVHRTRLPSAPIAPGLCAGPPGGARQPQRMTHPTRRIGPNASGRLSRSQRTNERSLRLVKSCRYTGCASMRSTTGDGWPHRSASARSGAMWCPAAPCGRSRWR